MTPSNNEFPRANVRESNFAERAAYCPAILALLLCAMTAIGCDSLKNHECCLFKPGGIFARDDEVKRLSSSEEKEAIMRASAANAQRRDAWELTEEELRRAKQKGVDLKNYSWVAQKPKGGVLFPRELRKRGPVVVMEPSTIVAPVGTDVVLVSSYVGADNEHMSMGERLDWELTGVGSFVSSNPRSAGLFHNCPLAPTSREVKGRSEQSETSSSLYTITRGTKTTDDDITILRGQSWMAVSSNEEGTSSVTVMADSIQNWNNRRANALIHWVDAAFVYPVSSVVQVLQKAELTTSVSRRTDSLAQRDWKVRYEIITGPGELVDTRNNAGVRRLDLLTGVDGKATVSLRNPTETAIGTTEIKISIMRPGTTEFREVVVDSRNVFYTWTSVSPLQIQAIAAQNSRQNLDTDVKIVVDNLNAVSAYDATVTLILEPGCELVNLVPTPGNGVPRVVNGRCSWTIQRLAPNQSLTATATIRKPDSRDINLSAQLSDCRPSGSGYGGAAQAPAPSASSGSGAVAPPTSTSPADVQPSLR